jgi:hypothetical protein
MVRQYSVNLLRHFFVKASETSLHVGYRDVKLGRGQSTSEGRIGIAIYQYPVGPFGYQYLFDAGEHGSGHAAMAAGTNPKMAMRFGNV